MLLYCDNSFVLLTNKYCSCTNKVKPSTHQY